MDDLSANRRALPVECQLDMPVQSLRVQKTTDRRIATSPAGMPGRRLFVFVAAIVLVIVAAHEMDLVVNASGVTLLGGAILVLFVALFAWIALAFVSALAGFVALLRGGTPSLGMDGKLPVLAGMTALLMPCYNEAPHRTAAGLRAIAESLMETGLARHFEMFVLSDTTDPAIWVEEEAVFSRLREEIGGMAVWYRHRALNTGRKAGNIADWVRRFGGGYPQMLILDADSVMTGDLIVRLAGAMEAHPGVGLIQTLPIIVNGGTLFARMQQFAGRLYGPLIAHGIAFWHGAEGNYWGHNAMIRTAAFASEAGLPELRGPKPFGGHVLSHDFVEAALIRRGQWAVHMVPAARGSYEESPPSLSDLAVRDRRWCQGNLQHAAVLPAKGLHWVSRLHMLMGIGSYITAPMWLLFLILGVLISLQSRFIAPDYFPQGHRLFPAWPVVDPVRSMWVFAGTMGLLLAPKLMSFVVLLTDRTERLAFGGAVRTFVGVMLETVFSGLLAPVTMVSQSRDVVSILMGRDSGWNAQRRDDGSLPMALTVRLYAWHTIVGAILGVVAFLVSPGLLIWMSPVVLGLLLSIPVVVISGSIGPARFLSWFGLLRIPEDVPPPVLARAKALISAVDGSPARDGLTRLVEDPALLEAHVRMLPPPRRPGVDPLDADLLVGMARIEESGSRAQAIAALSAREQRSVMGNERALRILAALA